MTKAEARRRREEGYRQYLAEEAERKERARAAYTAWVKEDARLRRAIDLTVTRKQAEQARRAWKAHAAEMPPLP